MACAWLVRGARARAPADPGERSPPRSSRAHWDAVCESARERARLAADHERRAALRRGRGALRVGAPGSATRVRRRSSSRRLPALEPGDRIRSSSIDPGPEAPMLLDPRPAVAAVLADLDAGAAPARDRRPLPRGGRAARPPAPAPRRRAPRARARGALRRRVPEPAPARAHRRAARADGPRGADPAPAAAQRRRDLLGQVAVAAARERRGEHRSGRGPRDAASTATGASGRSASSPPTRSRARAAELRAATGLGHRSRVSAVAAAWDALAAAMRERGAATVAELDPETVAERAEALWIVPPGGSLLP